jgi:hypothetical protein
MKTQDQERKEEKLHQIVQKSPPVVKNKNSHKCLTKEDKRN